MYEAGHPKLVLWDNLEGSGGEEGGQGVQEEGTHVYLWLTHTDVWQNAGGQREEFRPWQRS